MSLRIFAFILILLTTSGCSYRWGKAERTIPGGYSLIAVPVFKNLSQETGIEVYFTKALIEELERSDLAHVTPKTQAQAILEGQIMGVSYAPGAQVTNTTSDFAALPNYTVLTKEYRITVQTHLKLVRSSDLQIIWAGDFSGERRYPAPQILSNPLNSANALYNQSAHHQTIEQLAQDVMAEAADRMTENF